MLGESRELLKLAGPLLAAQLALVGTGVVDTVMAGRYNAVDLAAIAIGYNLWLPLYLVSLGIMFAIAIIGAQLYGARRREDIRALLPQALWVAAALGLITAPVCYFPGPVLEQLSLDAATYAKTEGYLQAVAFGLPGTALFQALRCHIQGIGLVRPFAVASVIGFFANIPLNYAFIYGQWGAPEMGAAGCGIATAISMWLSPVLIFFYTARSAAIRPYLPRLGWHQPRWGTIREILFTGVPVGATFFFEMAVFSFIGLLIATAGNVQVSAHQIAITTYDLIYIPLVSIGSAMGTRIGHGIGRGCMSSVKLSITCGMLTAAASCLVIAGILIFIPGPVARLYTEDEAIRALAVALLRLAVLFVLLDMVAVTTSFALRAFRDTRYPFLVMAIAYWLVSLPIGYWLGLKSPANGAVGFWWGMILGITIAAAMTSRRVITHLRRPLPAPPN